MLFSRFFWSQGEEAILYQSLILQTNAENRFSSGDGVVIRGSVWVHEAAAVWFPIGSIVGIWHANWEGTEATELEKAG